MASNSVTLSDHRVQALLAQRRTAILSTIQPDGSPLAMAMWFVHDAQSLTMVSVNDLKKVKNIRHDPRVCVVVESGDNSPSRCVSIRARATFISSEPEQARLVGQLFRKYPELSARWQSASLPKDRVLFQLHPVGMSFWG